MPISYIITLLALIAFPTNIDLLAKEISFENGPLQPAFPPDTSVSAKPLTTESTVRTPSTPTQLIIPAIGVNAYVVSVGVNARGEMEVPDGATNTVGWYQHGTVPGEIGSAVMDAHVFAAFKNLKDAEIGNRIYVADANGTMREFAIISSKVYSLASVPMQTIFTDAGGVYLNLITCEGRYSVTKGTYSHRRVVYAELVE